MDEAELRDMVAEIDDDGDGMVDIDEFKNMVLQTVRRIQEKVKIGGEGGMAIHEDAYRARLDERKANIQAQLGHGAEDGDGRLAVDEVAIIAAAKHQISFQEHHTTGDKDGGIDLRRNSYKEAAGVGMRNERPLKDLPKYPARGSHLESEPEGYHTGIRRKSRDVVDMTEHDRLEALRAEAAKRKLASWADPAGGSPNGARRPSTHSQSSDHRR